jgi:e2b2 family ribose-1,5-bisphosphate isomerase
MNPKVSGHSVPAKVSNVIKDIKSLKIQGAREVAKAGLECLVLIAHKSKARNKSDFMKEINTVTGLLAKVRPTEPMLMNVMKNVLLKLVEYDDFQNIGKVTENLCMDELMDIGTALVKIADIGSREIHDNDTILTHCHSHDDIVIFKEANVQGKKFHVVVTETRPVMQGILTAKDLLKSGISVTYCVDSAMGYVMKAIDKCIVGADAMFPDGSVVNKIGTLPMAITAKKFGKPFMVAGETYKFTPDVNIKIEQRDPREIIDPKKIPGAKIVNPAFDVTPADLISLIITEKGTVKPGDLKRMIGL